MGSVMNAELGALVAALAAVGEGEFAAALVEVVG